MGIESFLVASSVLGIVGQRLVRRICPSCKTSYTPTEEEMTFYEESGGDLKTDFCHGAGCNFCGQTGYQDRIGVYELLQMTPEIKRLIVGWATQDELRRLAQKQGHAHPSRRGDRSRSKRHDDHCRSHSKHLLALRRGDRKAMEKYKYTAIDTAGNKVSGVESALSPGAAHIMLLDRGYQTIEVSEKKSILQFEVTKKLVPRKDIMHFSRQLAVFVQAGVSDHGGARCHCRRDVRQAAARASCTT